MQTLFYVIITYTKMEVRCLCLEILFYGWSPLPKHIFTYLNIDFFFLLYKKVTFFNCFELSFAVYSYDAFPDQWNIPLLAHVHRTNNSLMQLRHLSPFCGKRQVITCGILSASWFLNSPHSPSKNDTGVQTLNTMHSTVFCSNWCPQL